jgi:hypothetical protein
LDSVRRLAASADSQIPYLVSLGTVPSIDELALEFDDAYPVFTSRIAEFDLPHRAVESLIRLNDLLLEMSGAAHAELWTVDALAESPRWSEVRRVASEILAQIDG